MAWGWGIIYSTGMVTVNKLSCQYVVGKGGRYVVGMWSVTWSVCGHMWVLQRHLGSCLIWLLCDHYCPYQVPVGTVVMCDGSVMADLTQNGETFPAARGGRGGLGNQHFATATDQAPESQTEGTPGEEKVLTMELRTIADIGLVGGPHLRLLI